MDELLKGFIPRPPVEEEIKQSLANGPRLCVLVGELGSGKSSLAASQIRSGGFLHHFLRKGHVEFGLWRDPYAFLTSIGFQLLERFGDSLFPETVHVDVRGRIQDVEPGAAVVGAEIGRLIAVPWRSGDWKVALEAARIGGDVVGARINEVVADYQSLPLTTYRRMALVDPLLRLQQLDPAQHVVLWIDGLDEEQQRRPGSDDDAPTMIGEALPTADELEELPNLSLGISARRGPHLNRFTDAGATVIALEDARFAKTNAAAVQSYVSRALQEPVVRAGLEKVETSAEEVQEELAIRAGSNFLYLRHFFEAVRQGQAALVVDGGLPSSLDEIYVRLMRRIENLSPDFLALDHVVLSALAVAYAPLSTRQLARFTKLDTNVVNDVIRRLQGFLDVADREMPPRYALYHPSFAQTLTSGQHQDEVWFIDVATAHERIGLTYLEAIETGWQDVDEYGFDFATDHLANATEPTRRRLLDLLGGSWRRAKRAHYGSNQAFETDLGLGARIAMALPLPEGLTELARLAFMRALLHETESQVPLGALEVLTAAGQLPRALAYVRAGVDPQLAIDRLSRILRGLAGRGADASGLVHSVLEDGLRWAALGQHAVNDDLYLLALLEACPATGEPAMVPLLMTARDLLTGQGQGFWTSLAGVELGRLVAPLDELEATRIFEAVGAGLPNIPINTIPETTGRLLDCWSALDPEAVSRWLPGKDIPLTHEVARGVLALAEALERRGNTDRAAGLRQAVATSFVANSQNPYNLSRLWTEIARSQVQQGDPVQASSTLDRAVEAAGELPSFEDSDGSVATGRLLYPVALAYAADVQVLVDRGKAQGILREAWESLKRWGYQEAWKKDVNLQTLVRAQHRANPDLLQAHIQSLNDERLRAQALVAAAREAVVEDRSQALQLVDETLQLTERPLGASSANQWHLATAVGLREQFYVALGAALGADDRTEAEALLIREGVNLPGRVRWRLGVLARLATDDNPAAREWLAETVRLWVDAQDDPGLLFEVPTQLASLPASWRQEAVRRMDTLDSPAHRVLVTATCAAQSNELEAAQELVMSWGTAVTPAEQLGILPSHQLLAFIAGQLGLIDSTAKQRLWINALLRFRSLMFSSSKDERNAAFWFLLENLMRGDPSAALPDLLAHLETFSPEAVAWRMPSPKLRAHVAAGMNEPSYLLALALGAALANGVEGADDHFSDVMPPSVRSLACSTAANRSLHKGVETRLAWCEEASRAAGEVQPRALCCLLLADAAVAFDRLGVKQRSQQLFRQVLEDFLQHRGPSIFYAPADAAYAHALGRCIESLAQAADVKTTTACLWGAAALGREGMWTVLSYLPSVLAPHGTSYLHRLHQCTADAQSSFTETDHGVVA